MSQVTAKQVQDLRKMSGAGMMDCKNALAESDGNLEDAFKWLREKGIAKAEKKSTRDANEGLVGIKTSDKGAVLDSTIDRIGELFIWAVIGIKFTHSNIELFTIFSILTSSGLIPYIRAKSEVHNIENKVGLAARPERVLFAVFFMYFEFSFIYVYIFAAITWITVFQRFYRLYTKL